MTSNSKMAAVAATRTTTTGKSYSRGFSCRASAEAWVARYSGCKNFAGAEISDAKTGAVLWDSERGEREPEPERGAGYDVYSRHGQDAATHEHVNSFDEASRRMVVKMNDGADNRREGVAVYDSATGECVSSLGNPPAPEECATGNDGMTEELSAAMIATAIPAEVGTVGAVAVNERIGYEGDGIEPLTGEEVRRRLAVRAGNRKAGRENVARFIAEHGQAIGFYWTESEVCDVAIGDEQSDGGAEHSRCRCDWANSSGPELADQVQELWPQLHDDDAAFLLWKRRPDLWALEKLPEYTEDGGGAFKSRLRKAVAHDPFAIVFGSETLYDSDPDGEEFNVPRLAAYLEGWHRDEELDDCTDTGARGVLGDTEPLRGLVEAMWGDLHRDGLFVVWLEGRRGWHLEALPQGKAERNVRARAIAKTDPWGIFFDDASIESDPDGGDFTIDSLTAYLAEWREDNIRFNEDCCTVGGWARGDAELNASIKGKATGTLAKVAESVRDAADGLLAPGDRSPRCAYAAFWAFDGAWHGCLLEDGITSIADDIAEVDPKVVIVSAAGVRAHMAHEIAAEVLAAHGGPPEPEPSGRVCAITSSESVMGYPREERRFAAAAPAVSDARDRATRRAMERKHGEFHVHDPRRGLGSLLLEVIYNVGLDEVYERVIGAWHIERRVLRGHAELERMRGAAALEGGVAA